MVVLRSISGSRKPPRTSIPRVNGVTSKRTISFVRSPEIIAPCIAAPIATASMGSTPLSGSLPITSATNLYTIGILVGPPIRIILPISSDLSFASSNACIVDDLQRSTIVLISSSSFERVSSIMRFLGELVALSYEMNGKLISVVIVDDNSIFAFSAASLILVIAVLSFFRSTPFSSLNLLTI